MKIIKQGVRPEARIYRVTFTFEMFVLILFICWMGGIDIFQREMAAGLAWLGACAVALVCWIWPGFWND